MQNFQFYQDQVGYQKGKTSRNNIDFHATLEIKSHNFIILPRKIRTLIKFAAYKKNYCNIDY